MKICLNNYHEELLDLVFGIDSPESVAEDEVLPLEVTTHNSLRLMYKLTKVEFYSSLQKEINNDDDDEEATVRSKKISPYDVFLIVPTFTNKNIEIAVCVPVREKKLPSVLQWYDENLKLWELDELQTIKKVASLSGTARVLENLERMSPLMSQAMERTNLFDVSLLKIEEQRGQQHEEKHTTASLMKDEHVKSTPDCPFDFFQRMFSKTLQNAVLENSTKGSALCKQEQAQENQRQQQQEKEYNSNSALNDSQLIAVSAMQSKSLFNSGFFCILGPPGTGKTTTLVDMIYAADEKVIVVAPSNAATANVALKLFKSSKFHITDICVYGQNCDESVNFLNPKKQKEKFSEFSEKYHDTDDETEKESLVRGFSKWLHLCPETTSIHDIYELCGGSEEHRLSEAQVVFSTLNSSGSEWLRRYSGDRNTLFLDEAGQCSEAEFYLACTYPGLQRVVVVGDPKQLPPTVIDQSCQEACLGRSWMSAIYEIYPNSVHLLDTQYRMDPEILRFPNEQFYDGRIQSGENVRNRLPAIMKPVGFVDTSRRSFEEMENFSFKNIQEASLIRALIRQDPDIKMLLNQDKEKPVNSRVRVVVITPYSAQKSLLETELKKIKGLNWSVATVDSFQGQESDIIIFSSVRTVRIGFVDDPQRLNVALTRAKRVLRIVGSKDLFEKIRRPSTLRKLVRYCFSHNFSSNVVIKNTVYTHPDWRMPSKWKATMTNQFHYSLKKNISERDEAVALNTLQCVTKPNINALHRRPNPKSFWQVSSLKAHRECSIVWVAKEGITNIIEAHFAGTEEGCLSFVQKNVSKPPPNAIKPKSDLSGLNHALSEAKGESNSVTLTWNLDNIIQRAIVEDVITDLPRGNFCLDQEQQEIVSSNPPLLIESRSGSGKTLILLQHAIELSRMFTSRHNNIEGSNKPIGFITVSKLLQSQLEKMYNEVRDIDTNIGRRSTCNFMSLSFFLDGLAKLLGIDVDVSDLSNFGEYAYIQEQQSHRSLPEDRSLIANEIGGVILGSQESAELRRALTWNEYAYSKRSNISSKEKSSSEKRRIIYNQFESYQRWKERNGRCDINDLVLKILQKLDERESNQLFSAVYLDEVQDFSYAMIYLICSIGGKSSLSWVFAGDTAQMISPGCSFKFAGLKQTLLSVQSGIEHKLKKVQHLSVNYRTTKDILDVGNAILTAAKTHFPGAIEFSGKERAINDFGLKVVLCKWDEAMQIKPSFGKDQALVYSFSRNTEVEVDSLKQWLGNHPFILSVLDSKGLEFDEVVVAFDLERSAWKVKDQCTISLSMLRELYVAVTRAKRRVVILVKQRSSDTMLKFLSEDLNCGLEYHLKTSELFEEFNTCTTTEEWFSRASQLFEQERFEVASRCYEKAECRYMYEWSKGLYYSQMNDKVQAMKHLCEASIILFKKEKYKEVLKVASQALLAADWTKFPPEFIDGKIFSESFAKYPNFLSHNTRLKIKIFLDTWENISPEDIERNYTLVNKRRNFPGLTKFLTAFHNERLGQLAKVIPCAVGDVYFARGNYISAVELFLAGRDFDRAEKSSECLIYALKKTQNSNLADLLELRDLWIPHSNHLAALKKDHTLSQLFLLLNYFDEAAKRGPIVYFKKFGERIVRFAFVSDQDQDPTILHNFCHETFHKDVLEELQCQFKDDQSEIVMWFHQHDDDSHAETFILENIEAWKIEELHKFIEMGLSRDSVSEEYLKRGLYFEATEGFIGSGNIERALVAANNTFSTKKNAEDFGFKTIRLFSGKRLPSFIPQNYDLASKLFYKAGMMDKKDCKECLKRFGKKVVQEFVIRNAPHQTIATNGQKIKVEVMDMLQKFGNDARLPHREVFDYFCKYNKIKCAEKHVETHISVWTGKDLSDIVKKLGLCTYMVAEERMKRGHNTTATRLFLKLKKCDEAIETSNRALSSPTIAEQNYTNLQNLWLTEDYKSRYVDIQNKLDTSSNLYHFLLLLQDPSHARELSKESNILERFGPKVIWNAVLRCAPYFDKNGDCEDELSILQSFGVNVLFERDAVQIFEHFVRLCDYDSASRFVGSHLSEWSDEHLLSFARYQTLVIKKLPEELFRRQFFDQAAVKYVDARCFEHAAFSSNEYLRHQCKKVTIDVAQSTLDLLRRHTEVVDSMHVCKTNHLLFLFKLFWNPVELSKNIGLFEDVVEDFDTSLILKAVFSHYLENCWEEDPKYIIEAFQFKKQIQFRDIDILHNLIHIAGNDKNKRNIVDLYLGKKIHCWSKQICTYSFDEVKSLLSFKSASQIPDIEDELMRRKMYVSGVRIHLSKKNVKGAITCSNYALFTGRAAAANALPLVNLWDKFFKDNNTYVEKEKIPETCKLFLLLRLFKDPEFASRLIGPQCLQMFGSRVILAAVSSKNYSEEETRKIHNAFGIKPQAIKKNTNNKAAPPPNMKSRTCV